MADLIGGASVNTSMRGVPLFLCACVCRLRKHIARIAAASPRGKLLTNVMRLLRIWPIWCVRFHPRLDLEYKSFLYMFDNVYTVLSAHTHTSIGHVFLYTIKEHLSNNLYR